MSSPFKIETPPSARQPLPAASALGGALAGAQRLLARFPRDPRALALRSIFPKRLPPTTTNRRIAIQAVENPFYFALFCSLYQRLREHSDIGAELVFVRSVSGSVGVGWRAALLRSALFSALVSARWRRLYAGVVDRVAYRSQSFRHPVGDVVDVLRAWAHWCKVRAGGEPFVLCIDGIEVGDLIIDSYLRFRPSPRFDAADPFTRKLVWQAHRDVRRARHYFRRSRPETYLTSYTTYLEHGIPVRVAIHEGVRVESFGTFARFGKRLTTSDTFHTTDASHYRTDFEALDESELRLAEAERQLSRRLSGHADTATTYMKVSAYTPTTTPVPSNLKGAVVVFLHDFYDSPHVYADLVFQDFWSWVCFTCDTLQEAGIPFFLKPHPNQITLSSAVMDELRAAYPTAALLDSRITNVQLVEAGVACGVTVYGTVAHELAFLGVPTIACARHPHHSFDFCRTARTEDQYREFLRAPYTRILDAGEMRRQALTFFYMHNLYGDAEELALRLDFASIWKSCEDITLAPAELARRMAAWRDSAAFGAFASRLIEEVPR